MRKKDKGKRQEREEEEGARGWKEKKLPIYHKANRVTEQGEEKD